MPTTLPRYHFRTRDNGALAFRVGTDGPSQRLDMEPIAVLNVKSGEIKPQGDRKLTDEDRAALTQWIAERQAVLKAREIDDIHRRIDELHQIAQFVQAKASDAQIAEFGDTLLLAMHDLRTALVRRMAETGEKKG